MRGVVIFVLLLSYIPMVRPHTLPDAPKAKIEAKSPVRKPGLLRGVFHDKQTITLAGVQAAAATADIISTVHWERKNRRAIEIGYPFHGGRPGVPAMAAEAVIEIGATGFLAHQMRTSRFRIMRALSFVPQSICITTHSAATGRNYVKY